MDLKPQKIGSIKSHFLDSGAFTLWTTSIKYAEENNCGRWDYYNTKEFKEYMDKYAAFIKKYKIAIDLYANIDVIGNPELTWRNQKYLEKKHGLSPVPVVHFGTDMKWLKKYIEEGYKLIGLGGLVGKNKSIRLTDWLDRCFDLVCDSPNRLPKVKIHGFGISSVKLWLRYPWWSIDSTSIHKKSAYGWILVPFYRAGKFIFDKPPLHISVSEESPFVKNKGRHLSTISLKEKEIVLKWLKHIQIPLGTREEKGIINNGEMRKLALYFYYEKMMLSLPSWPWPFTPRKRVLV